MNREEKHAALVQHLIDEQAYTGRAARAIATSILDFIESWPAPQERYYVKLIPWSRWAIMDREQVPGNSIRAIYFNEADARVCAARLNEQEWKARESK